MTRYGLFEAGQKQPNNSCKASKRLDCLIQYSLRIGKAFKGRTDKEKLAPLFFDRAEIPIGKKTREFFQVSAVSR
jgi:hypothetical protein